MRMIRDKKGRLNNKGMSIIELLIVMTIAVMIMAMLVVSYTLINRSSASKSMNRLVNVLRSARVDAMSKGQAAGVVRLIVDGGNVYARVGNNTDRELICGGGVIMTSALMGDYTSAPAPGTASTGGIVSFNTNGKLRQAGSDASTANCFLIVSGSKQYIVRVYAETGAIEGTLYTAPPAPEGGEGG